MAPIEIGTYANLQPNSNYGIIAAESVRPCTILNIICIN